MSKKKRRTKFEILRDREIISQLHIKKWKQFEIARELGLTQPTISKELAAIRKQWRESTDLNFELAQAEALANLATVEREAWEAWERSQQPKTTRTEDGDKVIIRVEDSAGDPRFLTTVANCIERRCKLLGLGEPETPQPIAKVQIFKVPEKCKSIEEWQNLAAMIQEMEKREIRSDREKAAPA